MAFRQGEIVDLTEEDESVSISPSRTFRRQSPGDLSTWSFPFSTLRSPSPSSRSSSFVSKAVFDTPVSNQSRGSSKRHPSNSYKVNPETPSKRRRCELVNLEMSDEEELIEISDDEDEPEIEDEEEAKWAIGVGNLIGLRPQSPASELSSSPRTLRKSAIKTPRNAPIQEPFEELSSIMHIGMTLYNGMTVELAANDLDTDEKYLKIKSIIRNTLTEEVVLRGWLLKRTRTMGGLLPTKLNEVALILDVDQDDGREIFEQSVLEVPISGVIALKKLIMTNKSMKARRFDRRELQKGEAFVYDNLELFCRWKLISEYADASARRKGRATEWRLEYLREGDCTPQEGICDEVRRQLHGNDAIVGGSSNTVRCYPSALRSSLISEEGGTKKRSFSQQDELEDGLSVGEGSFSRLQIDLTSGDHKSSSKRGSGEDGDPSQGGSGRHVGQKYTFADFFCGGGGAGSAAKLAGLELVYALDSWSDACRNYQANFPNTNVYHIPADRFVTDLREQYCKSIYVDILHLSPPCQTWSPAHTREGRDDDKNSAALFAVLNILRMVRSRIATLEQTFGLKSNHSEFLRAVVNMFTSEGYSVRWGVFQLANFGLPQTRKRLLIIAAAPGEVLPTFPPPTHSQFGEGGLKPWVTINDAILNIPADASLHDTAEVMYSPAFYRRPYDGNTQAKTITTSGGVNNYHPSGTRGFTLREFSNIQTFPPYYQFVTHHAKKMIGNAVPPKCGKALFAHIRRHLECYDGVIRQAHPVD